MRGISREVLARDLTRRISLASRRGCDGHHDLWDRQEAAHLTVSRTSENGAATADPLIQLCEDCPVRALCQQWAELDSYTGIAAGKSWVDGKSITPGPSKSDADTAA